MQHILFAVFRPCSVLLLLLGSVDVIFHRRDGRDHGSYDSATGVCRESLEIGGGGDGDVAMVKSCIMNELRVVAIVGRRAGHVT